MAKAKKHIDGSEKTKAQYLFILDETIKSFANREGVLDTILSENELEKVITHQDSLDAVIILAELDWDNTFPSSLYGLDIARELRRKHKLRCPIVITSSFPQSYFEEYVDKTKSKILYGRGIAFIQWDELDSKLDATIAELQEFPVTDAVLADMNEMLLNTKGIVIDTLTHDLKFEKVKNNPDMLKDLLNETAAYLSSTQLAELSWNEFQLQLSNYIADEKKFKDTAELLIKNCEQKLVNDDIEQSSNNYDKRHTILVVEDDPAFKKVIEDNLTNQFEKLIIKDNAREAIAELKKDANYTITGVISDWRLYADFSQKKHWQLQGYEVLEYAAKNHYAALFALTSLSDKNVHNIRNMLGLDIHLFKKQHLETTDSDVQWAMMADTVKQKCDVVAEVIASDKNLGASWFNSERKGKTFIPLRKQYIEKRHHEWNLFSKEVTEQTNTCWNYYKSILQSTGDGITLEDIGKKFNLPLEKSSEPILKNILIIRRIWLALWFNNTKLDKIVKYKDKMINDLPPEKIFCILRNQSTYEIEQDILNGQRPLKEKKVNGEKKELSAQESAIETIIEGARNLKSALCIANENLAILPEEKSWLLSLGIDIQENDLFDFKAKNNEEDEWSEESLSAEQDTEPTAEDINEAQPLLNSSNEEEEL